MRRYVFFKFNCFAIFDARTRLLAYSPTRCSVDRPLIRTHMFSINDWMRYAETLARQDPCPALCMRECASRSQYSKRAKVLQWLTVAFQINSFSTGSSNNTALSLAPLLVLRLSVPSPEPGCFRGKHAYFNVKCVFK